MPNWCSQFVEVRGEEKEIKRMIDSFRNKAAQTEEDEQWDINQLFPVPDELAETPHAFMIDPESKVEKDILLRMKQEKNMAKYGARDWFDWQVINWGTKWGAKQIEIDEDALANCSESFSFTFASPWGTTPGLMAKVSSIFPSVLIGIHAIEMGMMFAVWEIYHDGKMIDYGEADEDTDSIDSDEKWGECVNKMFTSASEGSFGSLDKNMHLIAKG